MTVPMNPSPIIELATAYWGSATLIAACQLDIFSLLDEGPVSPADVALARDLDLAATDALLAGCAGLDLITKTSDGFQNTELTSHFLVKGKPGFLGPALQYNGDVYPLWAQLHSVVKAGRATAPPDAYLGDDATRTRNFVYGMHHRALGVGRAVAQVIDLSDRKRLADVGGGPGTYSTLLTQQTPGLHADVLDLPGVVDVAREIIESMGAADRVAGVPFDYYKDELSGPYDCALISGVLHREQPEGVQALLHKTSKVLELGSPLYISDVMLDDDRAGPLFGTMFALNMRVLAHDGRCHSVAEQTAWLEQVGCVVKRVTKLPAPIHYTVIEAEKIS